MRYASIVARCLLAPAAHSRSHSHARSMPLLQDPSGFTIDANHPLAGAEMKYTIEVIQNVPSEQVKQVYAMFTRLPSCTALCGINYLVTLPSHFRAHPTKGSTALGIHKRHTTKNEIREEFLRITLIKSTSHPLLPK